MFEPLKIVCDCSVYLRILLIDHWPKGPQSGGSPWLMWSTMYNLPVKTYYAIPLVSFIPSLSGKMEYYLWKKKNTLEIYSVKCLRWECTIGKKILHVNWEWPCIFKVITCTWEKVHLFQHAATLINIQYNNINTSCQYIFIKIQVVASSTEISIKVDVNMFIKLDISLDRRLVDTLYI